MYRFHKFGTFSQHVSSENEFWVMNLSKVQYNKSVSLKQDCIMAIYQDNKYNKYVKSTEKKNKKCLKDLKTICVYDLIHLTISLIKLHGINICRIKRHCVVTVLN